MSRIEVLTDLSNKSWERQKFLSDNCVKLAQFLEDLPDTNHDQRQWLGVHRCGTVGCALGWAVNAQLLEGLDTRSAELSIMHYGTVDRVVSAVVNRPNSMSWEEVGVRYFGQTVFDQVFLNIDNDRITTINALYDHARTLCDNAKRRKRYTLRGWIHTLRTKFGKTQ